MRHTLALFIIAAVVASIQPTIPLTLSTDTQTQEVLLGNTFEAEARIGPNKLSGDCMLGARRPSATYRATNQATSPNGEPFGFALSCGATTRNTG